MDQSLFFFGGNFCFKKIISQVFPFKKTPKFSLKSPIFYTLFKQVTRIQKDYLLSELVYSQIWLNRLVDDRQQCHNLKKDC
jgi:hypothetical protein